MGFRSRSAVSRANRLRPGSESKPSRRLVCRLEHLEERALLAINGAVIDGLGNALPVNVHVADKIGDELAYLSANYQSWAGNTGRLSLDPSSNVYQPSAAQPNFSLMRFGPGTVGVSAVSTGLTGNALAREMANLGAQVTGTYGVMVSAMVPDAALPALADLPDLRSARPNYLPVVNAGKADSQAVPTQRTDIGALKFGVDGTGITVGLLSDSFNNKNGYNADVASGDLPAGVQVLSDMTSGGTDEGRAMAQLVYDIAPGSKLAYSTAFLSEASFAQGIINLAKPTSQGGAGAQVISDDVFYYEEPIFQDGVIAQAVNTAANTYGASYFSSAGNQSNHAYQTTWNGTTASPAGMPANSTVQDFGGSTGIFLPISGHLSTTFQWDSPYASAGNGSPGSSNQVDLYFYAADKTTLIGVANDNALGADPTQIFDHDFGTQAYMVVRLSSGPAPTTFKYVNIGGGTMPYNSGASFGHNQAAGGAGVAASAYNGTPAYGNSPPQADSYTSLGGTAILFDPAGNRLATPDLRQQPRFTGVDGPDTTFFGYDFDGNGLPNFFGTSAAAPDIAGVAALMKQAVPSLTPPQIYAALAATAIDMNTPGYDYRTGAGLIQADSALAYVTANSISGTVYQDSNGDAVQNNGELGLAGKTVFLDTNSNGTIDSGTTDTLTSTDVPKAIPDGTAGTPSRVSSSLNVSGVPGRVTKVSVTLSISHTKDSDLTVSLISPSGMRINLINNNGSTSALGFTNTVLDDAAATSIYYGSAPFTGSYRPLVKLSALNGENPNGTWRLEARDNFTGNTGTIQAWSLAIKYAETSTTTDASGHYSFNAAPPSSYYGTYAVRTLIAAPYVLSAPLTPYNLTLVNSAPLTGQDFGLTLPLLTITANDVTRVYGAPDPTLGVTYSGFVGSDTPSSLGGSLSIVDTYASPTTDVGSYPGAILAAGQTSSSYRISYVPGNLTVLAAPTVTNLVSLTNPNWYGSPVTFTATVTASAPSAAIPTGSIQFIVDGANYGTPISLAARAASLTLSDLSAGDHTVAAAYLADPDFISSQSTNLTQTINAGLAAPSITTQPANATVTAGNNASFTAAASGNPNPTVQWQVSTDNGLTWSNIPGANSNTYSFATADTDNGSLYQAIFSNTQGSATSKTATLTVQTRPSITTQPANATVTAGNNASFTAAASGNPNPSVQWQVSTDNGVSWTNIPGANSSTYSFTTTLTDNGSLYQAVFSNNAGSTTSRTATLIVNAPLPAGTATFLQQDSSSQGNWKMAYGVDGFNVSQDASPNNPSLPSYAGVSFSGTLGFTWNGSTSDPRALQKAAPGSNDRIAGTWYSASSFSIDVRINDGKTHQVTLYALDWDNNNRTETIQAIDDATGTVLDTRSLASFRNGVYLAWNISGSVTFQVTNTGTSPNAVLSGLFFGGAPVIAGQATFLKTDTTTQGNWKAAYGAEGFNLSQDSSANNPNIPTFASLAFNNAKNFVWSNSTSDVRALQKAAPNSTDRVAGAWYNSNSLSVDLKTKDGKPHQVAVYALDWDGNTRAETVQITDASTGSVLDTQTLTGFYNGVYLVWNVLGNVTIKVTNTGSSNAVLNGIFLGGAPGGASFVKQDTATAGNWKAFYAADGFVISQDPSVNNPSLPAYAGVTFNNAKNAVWSSSTSDVRALQKAAPNSTDRVAGAWFNSNSFSIDVKINDGKVHQLGVYAVDWDGNTRAELIQVIDTATGAVLDTQTLTGFHNGVYLAWNIQGNVTVKVTNTGTSNAVLSGLFFGGAPLVAGQASFVKQDTTTQGTWKGTYGLDGFAVSQDPSAGNPSFPAYATVNLLNTANFVWNSATSDARALQKSAPGATDRIAGTWFNADTISAAININDGKSHQVALYAVDWDNSKRTETIQIIDTATGSVLDSQSLAGFQNGVYLVWNIKGSVTVKIINTGSSNAVLSGLFFQ